MSQPSWEDLMGEQIDHIVWYERRHRMVVTYGDGEPDRIVADELVAARLAQDAGLVLVPTPPGTVRWVRNLQPRTLPNRYRAESELRPGSQARPFDLGFGRDNLGLGYFTALTVSRSTPSPSQPARSASSVTGGAHSPHAIHCR